MLVRFYSKQKMPGASGDMIVETSEDGLKESMLQMNLKLKGAP